MKAGGIMFGIQEIQWNNIFSFMHIVTNKRTRRALITWESHFNLDFRFFKNKDLVQINRKVTPLAKVLAKGEWNQKWAVKKDDDYLLKAWNQLEQFSN